MTRTLSKIIALALACAPFSAVAAEMLPGSEWEPVWMEGKDHTPLQETFLQFDQDGGYFGNAGCNAIRGRYVTNDAAILLSPAAAAMMACPEEIAQQEFAFIRVLMAARLHDRDGTSLSLMDSDGTVILKLRQRDAD